MDAKLIIAPEAQDDLDAAYNYYEKQRQGLGEEFLECVDAAIARIIRQPFMYEVVLENYRRAMIRRFPFTIFYEYVAHTVTVYCVFHSSRDPNKWQRRLGA